MQSAILVLCCSCFSYLVMYECFLLMAMALKLVEKQVSSVESTKGPGIQNGTVSTAKATLATLEKGISGFYEWAPVCITN